MANRPTVPAKQTENETLSTVTQDWDGAYVDRLGRTISVQVSIARVTWVEVEKDPEQPYQRRQWADHLGTAYEVRTSAMRNGKGYGAYSAPTRHATLEKAEAHVAKYLKQAEKAAQKRHGK